MTTYKTKGTCSTRIHYEVVDGNVHNVRFDKGCSGNLQGIAALVEGRSVEEVVALLSGIQCHNGTSCPDQLARALRAEAE
ncbi:MAG: TIGR03905 family TSCPD domain-containing protein [Eubacteriales bacterium]|nr:TIGR03905 family TSCPD domain-containing protein [Eubacteriales bacterium]